MNARQLISSGVAAFAVAGTIGLAYAQTTDGIGTGSSANTPAGRVENSTNASTTNETLNPSTPSSTDQGSSGNRDNRSSELPAQADRG